jgi:hypothetical protein
MFDGVHFFEKVPGFELGTLETSGKGATISAKFLGFVDSTGLING